MDPKLYPSGRRLLSADKAVPAVTLADKIPLVRGEATQKYITLETLLGGLKGLGFSVQDVTEDDTIEADASCVLIDSNTPATALAITGPVPAKGKFLVIANASSGTAANAVTLPSGCYFDGHHQKATFDNKGEALVLLGVSDTEFMVLSNMNSVTLATP